MRSVKHVPSERTVFFELVSIADKPDIRMSIRYMKLLDRRSSLYMVSSIRVEEPTVLISAMAEKDIESIGKKITQNIYNLHTEGDKHV
jgi:hypothetical protein